MNDKATEYINLIYKVLSREEITNLRTKLVNFLNELWESNSLSAEYPMNLCTEIIDIIDNNINFDEDMAEALDLLLSEGRFEQNVQL